MSRIALMKKGGKWFAKNIPVTRYWKWGTEINATTVGSPSINGTVVSGFSASSYLTIPYIDFVPSNYESVIKFTTPSSWRADATTECIGLNSTDYTGYIIVIGAGTGSAQVGSLAIKIGYGNKTWGTIVAYGDYILNTNTTYWIKTTWDGSTWKSYISTDGEDYTQIGNDLTNGFGTLLTSKQILGNSTDSYYGKNYFTGSIDLSGCYIKLNNKIWWNGVKAVETIQDDYDFTTVENHYYGFKKG